MNLLPKELEYLIYNFMPLYLVTPNYDPCFWRFKLRIELGIDKKIETGDQYLQTVAEYGKVEPGSEKWIEPKYCLLQSIKDNNIDSFNYFLSKGKHGYSRALILAAKVQNLEMHRVLRGKIDRLMKPKEAMWSAFYDMPYLQDPYVDIYSNIKRTIHRPSSFWSDWVAQLIKLSNQMEDYYFPYFLMILNHREINYYVETHVQTSHNWQLGLAYATLGINRKLQLVEDKFFIDTISEIDYPQIIEAVVLLLKSSPELTPLFFKLPHNNKLFIAIYKAINDGSLVYQVPILKN